MQINKVSVHLKDLGPIQYAEAWAYQTKVFNQMLAEKAENHVPRQSLLFCEHPHVFTLGKSGDLSNLLLGEEELQKRGISFYKTDRGGDITYHGPGQLVVYPLLDLEQLSIGLREFVHLMEESILRLLKDFDIEAGRIKGASGVWIENNRKICALGVRSSRHITMHGLALNVNTNLDFFSMINPCGFIDKGVTSIQKEKKQEIEMESVKALFLKHFEELFQVGFY